MENFDENCYKRKDEIHCIEFGFEVPGRIGEAVNFPFAYSKGFRVADDEIRVLKGEVRGTTLFLVLKGPAYMSSIESVVEYWDGDKDPEEELERIKSRACDAAPALSEQGIRLIVAVPPELPSKYMLRLAKELAELNDKTGLESEIVRG